MADHLAKKDWRSAIKNEKNVKKTGMSEAFDAYASAVGKGDLDRQSLALDEILEKARSVSAKYRDNRTVRDFLSETIKLAERKDREVAALRDRAAKARVSDAKAGDEDEVKTALAKTVRKLKQRGPDRPWNFVMAPGKPVSGLVLTRKKVKTTDVKAAFAMKGKKGVWFAGRVHGGRGGLIFDLDAQPPGGLAKMIRRALLLHSELTVKVTVTGGGVELTDDADIEEMAGGDAVLDLEHDMTGLSDEDDADEADIDADEDGDEDRETDPEVLAGFTGRIDRLRQGFDAQKVRPAARTEGALSGVIGLARQIGAAVEASSELSDDDRAALVARTDAVATEAGALAESATSARRKSAYPSDGDLRVLVDKVLALDPRQARGKATTARDTLRQLLDRVEADKTLSATERKEIAARLAAAVTRLRTVLEDRRDVSEELDTLDPAITRRIAAIDRSVQGILTSPMARAPETAQGLKRYRTLRAAVKDGEADTIAGLIGPVEADIASLRASADSARAAAKTDAEAEVIRERLTKQTAFVKKAVFPKGLIADHPALLKALKTDTAVRDLVAKGSACVKATTPDTVADLAAAAKAALKTARARIAAVENGVSDDAALDLAREFEAAAKDALRRANLADIALRFEALKDAPLDAETRASLAEVQAEFLFAEAAVARGEGSVRAPGLGSDAGASGSWWIERAGARPGDGPRKEYIFKPAELEGLAFPGLAPGSGAPREVLAKTLDSALAEAGFEIGVCPTTLASLDAAYLTGMDEDGGRKLGSMQKFAANDGGLTENHVKDPTLAARIDKKNYDDIAAFDMMFSNFDRHGANVLIATDETGQPRLMPIDHGSGLAPPDITALSRQNLMPPFNVMADESILPQAGQVLNLATRDQIKRLDPDRLVAAMMASRDGIETRHSQTAGMVEDDAIEALGNRTRFLQAACDRMTASELFEAMSVGARRIAAASPDGMDALATRLKTEIEARRAALPAIGSLSKACGELPGTAKHFKLKLFQELGWIVAAGSDEIDAWMQANAALADRILKTGMKNPAAVRAIAANRDEALRRDPGIERKLKDREDNLGTSLGLILETLSAPEIDIPPRPPKDESEKAAMIGRLTDAYAALGGDAAFAEACALFPRLAQADRGDAFRFHADAVRALTPWKAFKDLGGVDEMLRLDGMISREAGPDTLYKQLAALKASETARHDLMALDPSDIARQEAETATAGLAEIDAATDRIRSAEVLKRLAAMRDEIVSARNGGDLMRAAVYLRSARTTALDQIAGEARQAEKAADIRTTIAADVAAADPGVQAALAEPRRRMEADLDAALAGADWGRLNGLQGRWRVLFEAETLGDDSPLAKAREDLAARRAELDAEFGGTPVHPPFDARLRRIAADLDAFILSRASGDIERLARSAELAREILAMLDDRLPADLPDPIRTAFASFLGDIDFIGNVVNALKTEDRQVA